MEEQIERLTTINESVRKTLGASKARIHVLATEKAELQTELRALRCKDESPVESDEYEADEEAEDVEGFMESYSEQQEQNSEEEEKEVDEETVQNSEENGKEVVAISNGKPPPKPPRLQLEVDENADVLNNNKSNVEDNETTTKVERKENEINVKENGNEEEEANGDWEFVGRPRSTAYNREKSEEERKRKRAENQKRAEKENKDPNRPRYTKAEMLEILTERNKLKERVFALQDELKIYKPG